MARNVQCRRYGEELEGLERPPLPGAKGQDIFDNVSKKGVARVAGSPDHAHQRETPQPDGPEPANI